MSHTTQQSVVSELPLFRHLDDAGKAEVAERFERIGIQRGFTLVAEGEQSDSMYVVLSGRFSVTRRDRDHPISEIGVGQPIGEIGFLTGSARIATVTALRDSIVLKLDRQKLEALEASDPAIWRAISNYLATRLADTTLAPPKPPNSAPRTILLAAAGDTVLDSGLIHLVTTAFAARAPTLVVNSEMYNSVGSGDCSPDDLAMTERFNALEAAHTYVLMIADPSLTAWNRKIIHHADLMLAAGSFDTDPTPNATEVFAAGFLPPSARRLLLVHDTRRVAHGTRGWLSPREILMHHHAARDDIEDFARIVRFIDGTARGLVLAGGGALCVTHVGLYKTLVEAGYSFDIMGGTSGGGAMAAAFALGAQPEDVSRSVHDMFVKRRAMRRFTFPRYSVLDHTHFDRELKALYGETNIEDLWLPFFAVSTNLSRYARHIHLRGPVWRAVRASASIPVLLPPVYTEQGEMLVDGSLVDNVPVTPMHQLKSGPNIVVAFDGGQIERFDVAYDQLPSRAELLRRAMTSRFQGALHKAPGPVNVLMRSLMANRHKFREELEADDLLLVPPIPTGIGFLDWHRHDDLLEAGYEWARTQLKSTAAAQ